MTDRLQSRVTAGPGGAMTEDVGVITGDLTVVTTALPDGGAAITVQYTGAEEWYTLTGSPVPVPEDGLQALHNQVINAITADGAATAPR